MAHHIGHLLSECVTTCTDCRRVCLETLTYCLTAGEKHADAKHIQLMIDCVDICDACTGAMIRASAHHAHFCELCAKICTACAESCEKFGDDKIMNACAEACRKCAESCGSMAKSMDKSPEKEVA